MLLMMMMVMMMNDGDVVDAASEEAWCMAVTFLLDCTYLQSCNPRS